MILTLAPSLAASHAGPHPVEVSNNAFGPALIEVDPGDTVTWTLAEGIHTVTSDVPGAFGSGTMNQMGTSFEAVMPAEDVWVYYHCQIHGSPGEPAGDGPGIGMFGVIKVGDPPPKPLTVEVRPVPSPDWPTVIDALSGLRDTSRYRIELAAGTHRIERGGSPMVLDRSNLLLGIPGRPLATDFALEIAGVGSAPGDVVLAGGVLLGNVRGVTIRDVSIEDAPYAGVQVDAGATHWSIANVLVPDAARYGVLIKRGSRLGGIAGTTIDGASVAGIAIEDCAACDLIVDRVTVTGSLQGISGTNAGTVIVTRSTFDGNGVGIALKSTAGADAPVRGAHLWGNTITDSTNRDIPPPPPSARLDLPVGAGVWLAGVSFASIQQNRIEGASFPIVITGPAYGARVVDNVVGGAVEADLAWNGLGAHVCFRGNAREDGSQPTSMPPAIQQLYDCALPTTVGVPYPLVDERVISWGASTAG